MAKIKQAQSTPSALFDDVFETSRASVPAISLALYAEVVRLAAEKYDPVLKRLTAKGMKESVDKFRGISFVNKRPFEVEVLVISIAEKTVSFWITFDLYGLVDTRHALLQYLWRECMGSHSEIRVENGSFVGEVELHYEPAQATNTRTRRITHFLGDDKSKSPEPHQALQKFATVSP